MVLAPDGVMISVKPLMLFFVAVNQKLPFTVQVTIESPVDLVPGDSLKQFLVSSLGHTKPFLSKAPLAS